jgi:5-methylcytosine-specific restriction endonuclease McrA
MRTIMEAEKERKQTCYQIKTCRRCGVEYLPTGTAQKYCLYCRPIVRKERNHLRILTVAQKAGAKAYEHKRYEQNKAVIRAKSDAYYEKNREVILLKEKEYGLAHPKDGTTKAKDREYAARYYLDHIDKKKGYNQTRRAEICIATQKRRALKKVNTPKDELLTLAQWNELKEQFDYSCAYCGRKPEKLTIDHVIPLSQGGAHSKDNIVPACGHCNSSKRERTPLQWALSRI